MLDILITGPMTSVSDRKSTSGKAVAVAVHRGETALVQGRAPRRVGVRRLGRHRDCDSGKSLSGFGARDHRQSPDEHPRIGHRMPSLAYRPAEPPHPRQ
ncbi:hypothetical protein [Sphaerisporangium melleum]|uniref:hypothetical protein n=1 Tax=Sphaerisporangium melleum TaxID=321316 RepID=UPI001E61DED5|nr:hypothetical protein [Sphaerisporangium melleum]